MKIDLSGKTAVIVGASGGLGEAMAHALSEAGASIALVGRNQAKLDSLGAALAKKGGTAASFTADLTKERTRRASSSRAPKRSAASTSWSTTRAPPRAA